MVARQTEKPSASFCVFACYLSQNFLVFTLLTPAPLLRLQREMCCPCLLMGQLARNELHCLARSTCKKSLSARHPQKRDWALLVQPDSCVQLGSTSNQEPLPVTFTFSSSDWFVCFVPYGRCSRAHHRPRTNMLHVASVNFWATTLGFQLPLSLEMDRPLPHASGALNLFCSITFQRK